MTVQPTRDQLRALAAAATPGPWVAGEPRGWGDNDDEPQSDIDTPAGVLTWDDHGGEVFKPDDAEFIAAARNALPALLDALDQAEADRDWNLRSSRLSKEERIKANARADQAEAERDQARAQVDRVRELHQPCSHDAPCRGDCAECGQHMPCDTIRALEG